jgi:hypothetical protein
MPIEVKSPSISRPTMPCRWAHGVVERAATASEASTSLVDRGREVRVRRP